MSHPSPTRASNRLDDLCAAVAPGGRRIQKVGVRTIAGDADPVMVEKPFDVIRIGVETGDGGKTEFRAEAGPVGIVGHIRVMKSPAGQFSQLGLQNREGGVQGKASDIHCEGGIEVND